jgi:hypothetical protein
MAALLAVAPLAQAEIDRPAAETLERKSGLWEQWTGVASQIEAGLQQAMAQAGVAPAESEKARIARVVRTAYAADRLRSISTGVMAANLQPQHLRALRRWFDSPPGEAVARAEEATPMGQADPAVALKAGRRLLASMPLERRKLLQDLIAATHAAEGLVQITISTTVAAQLGAASALPGVTAPSARQMRAVLEEQRPEMLKAFTRTTMATFAQVYAKLSSEQLRDYLEFVRSPAGAAFNEVSLHAAEAALTGAAAEMGRYLPGTSDRNNI